jgi:uncharacterized protein (UPF0332 family)
LSVLTKLFVVLLVVSSLLLSASVVVFVNQAENHRATAMAAKTALQAQVKAVQELNKIIIEHQQAYAALQGEMSNRVGGLERKLVEKDSAMQAKQVELAKLETDAQLLKASLKGTTDALDAAQKGNTGLQEANLAIRSKYDETLKKYGEVNTEITNLINQKAQLEKERNYTAEQLVEAKAAIATLRQKAGNMADATGAAPDAAPGPINGVVRSVDVIGGKKYATISVGSSDNVKKGMKFNVVNTHTGEFLGFLTVDSVQPNEAIGQVEGKVDKIQKDVEVKTQL